MFMVKSIQLGKCIACGKETECFEVEAQRQFLTGLLCMSDFKRQVKIVTATAAPAPTVSSSAATS
jgi:hypothetical protein